MKVKNVNSEKYLSLILLILAVTPLVIISKCTTLYGDDFIYATYFLGGFKNFLSMTYQHYINMNGRAIVHFLLEVILIFKDGLFFVVIPLLLISVFVLYRKASVKDSPSLYQFITVCILCTLCLSPEILRESLLWMAGAMNYIYPTTLAFAALFVQKKAVSANKVKPIYALIMFLCGATTEQGGAMAAAVAILYILSALLKGKTLSKFVLTLPLFIIIGYLTVILSPSTSARTVQEASEEAVSFIKRMDNLYFIALGKNGALWVFEIALAMFALGFRNEIKSITRISVIAIISTIVLSMCHFTLVAGLIMTIAYLYICFTLFFNKIHTEKAIITLSALMSVGMLLFSTTFGYRNIFPCLLSLICVSADIFLECLPENPLTKYTSIILVFAITAISAYPLIDGYMDNRKIINENLANIKANADGFYYNADINSKYGYNQFISDNYYRDSFRKIYNIDDNTKIYIKGKDFTDLRLNNIHLEYPMYTENNTEYFPLRNVIKAYGGSIEFDESSNQTRIDINNKKVYYDNIEKCFYIDGKQIDATASVADNKKYGRFFEFNQYFTRDIFENVFSIIL